MDPSYTTGYHDTIHIVTCALSADHFEYEENMTSRVTEANASGVLFGNVLFAIYPQALYGEAHLT